MDRKCIGQNNVANVIIKQRSICLKQPYVWQPLPTKLTCDAHAMK